MKRVRSPQLTTESFISSSHEKTFSKIEVIAKNMNSSESVIFAKDLTRDCLAD